jgi:hypothetical protein
MAGWREEAIPLNQTAPTWRSLVAPGAAPSDIASGETPARPNMSAPPAGDALALMQQAGLAGAQDTGPANFAEMQRTASAEIGADTQERIAPYVDPFLNNAHGFTYGYSDEMLSGLMSQMGRVPQDEIAGNLGEQREDYYERAPGQAIMTEIVGLLGNPLSRLGPGQGSLGKQVVQSGLTGGLLSYLYGTGTAEGDITDRMTAGVDDGLIGAGISMALPVVGAAVGRGVDAFRNSRAMREAARAAPSMDDIRTTATQLYDQADNAIMPRAGMAPAVQQLQDDAARMALDPMLMPQASRAMDNVVDAATSPDPNITFRELDILRRQAGVPAGDVANRPQAAVGARIQQAIDEFVDNADPQTSAVLREARDLWGRLRRSEVIEQAIEKAGRQASGFENGIRVQFRQILNNPRLSRSFTQAERDAIEQVIRGTPVGNAMRWMGKMGVGLNQNTNVLGATIGAITGNALGGPWGAGILPVVGTVARYGAEKTTEAAARGLVPMIASGGLPAIRQVTPAIAQISAMLGGAASRPIASELDLPSLLRGLAQ